MLINKKQTLLTESQIGEMVVKFVSGVKVAYLEDEYGIGRETIRAYIKLWLKRHNLEIKKVLVPKGK